MKIEYEATFTNINESPPQQSCPLARSAPHRRGIQERSAHYISWETNGFPNPSLVETCVAELRGIEENKDSVRSKLKEVGATLSRPEFLQKRIVFRMPEGHEIKGGWLRVRDEKSEPPPAELAEVH